MASRYENRQRIIDTVRGVLVDHPFEQLSLAGIAEAAGVSIWALRHHFENVDGLFRIVGHQLIEEVAAEIDYRTPPAAMVVDSIRDFAEYVAKLVGQPNYRDLVYLVVRNGRRHDWLQSSYEERVVGRICATLDEVVRRSGERHGVTVLLRDHAARRFHRRIETELVLAELLPSPVDRDPPDLQRLLRDVACETFEATYVFEWGSASAA